MITDASAALERIRGRYQNKRTLGYGLVNDCIELAEQAIVVAEAKAEARADGRIVEVERHLERAQENQRRLSEQVLSLSRALDVKRKLVEARDQAGEEVKVTIGRSLGGWVVGDLEEIAYRLRCGGAVDETPVKVTEYTASANVLAPNLVPLSRPTATQTQPELLPAVVPDRFEFAMRRLALLMAVAFVLGLLVAVAGVVIL